MIYTTFFSSSLLTILIFIFSISLPCFSPVFATSTDTLIPSDSLSINQTLISSSGKFELGFFKIENPTRYYLGIWYKDIPSKDIKVWVANRDAPSLSNSSTLKLRNDANLTILDDKSVVIWSSNTSNAVNPVLQLLDSGNLVIHEAGDHNSNNYIWQSFDDPTDTLLPGQKFGWNLKTGLDRFLSSWRSPSDPGTGIQDVERRERDGWVDKSIGELYSVDEALRCLQLGLLCVQERAEERPTMASVVLILTSESTSLPQPKLPGLSLGCKPNETDFSLFTVNQATVTLPIAR